MKFLHIRETMFDPTIFILSPLLVLHIIVYAIYYVKEK